jgi:hypothetical protein
MVSAIARGCSWISFCMKWRYGPELQRGQRHVGQVHLALDGLPSASNTRTAFAA